MSARTLSGVGVACRSIVWVAGAALAACGSSGPEQPWPDFGGTALFAAQAQPILAARCANPSCHGNAQRPLALFAPLRYRDDPALMFVDSPLSATEIEANYRRSIAFLLHVDRADASRLLAKPLGVHAGVHVFADPQEQDAQQLRDWANTAISRSRANANEEP